MDFPFDTQVLTIAVSSNIALPTWPIKFGKHNVTLRVDANNKKNRKWLSQRANVMSFFVNTSNVSLTVPKLQFHEETKQPLDKFPKLLIEVAAERQSTYCVTNIMLPVFMITILCTTVFGIPISTDSGVENRLAVTLALVLTVVAYKITAADSLPQLGYLTELDTFILANFGFLVLTAFENLFAALYSKPFLSDDKEWVEDFDTWCLGSILILYAGVMLTFVSRGIYFKHFKYAGKTVHEISEEQGDHKY